MKAPCKDCAKRHFRCHSGCGDYEAYIEEREKIRKCQSEAKKVVSYHMTKRYDHRHVKTGGYFSTR